MKPNAGVPMSQSNARSAARLCTVRQKLVHLALLLIVGLVAIYVTTAVNDKLGFSGFAGDLLPHTTLTETRKHLRYICKDASDHTKNKKLFFCGGWADRFKGATYAYYLAERANRHFHMAFEGSSSLHDAFVANNLIKFDGCNANDTVTYRFVKKAPTEREIQEIVNDKTPCIDFFTQKKIPGPNFDRAASSLWTRLHLLPSLQARVDAVPKNLLCLQIRQGKSKTWRDSITILTPDEVENIYAHFAKVARERFPDKKLLLWTDTQELLDRLNQDFPDRTVRLAGHIMHLDSHSEKTRAGVKDGFQRLIMEWALIPHCDHIYYQWNSGFIRLALFLANPRSKQAATESWSKGPPK